MRTEVVLLPVLLFAACASPEQQPRIEEQNVGDTVAIAPPPTVRSQRTDFDVDSFIAGLPVDRRYFMNTDRQGGEKSGFLEGFDLDSALVFQHLTESDLHFDNPNAEEACSALFPITDGIVMLGKPGKTLKHARLSYDQRDKVLAIINAPDACESMEAACFDPHHTFVFFDKQGKIAGAVQVCFSCQTTRFSHAGSDSSTWGICNDGWNELTKLVNGLELQAELASWR